MRFQLSIIALLLLCSAAVSAESLQYDRSTGDINGIYATSDGSTRYGTAYAVAVDGESAYWVTCLHTVKSAEQVTMHKRTGTVVHRSEADDIAIIRTESEGIIPFALSDPADGPGSTYGYPLELVDLRMLTGSLSDDIHWETFFDGDVQKSGDRSRMQVVCHRGWSGGPIVQRGRCVGMITASCSEGSLYVNSSRIRYHLTQCISGQCRQSFTYRQRYLYRPAFIPPAILPPRVEVIQTPIVQVEPSPAPQPAPRPAPVNEGLAARLGSLEQSVSTLTEAVTALANREPQQGPPGERGPAGPPGPAGINGASGRDATQAQIDAAVAKYMKANPPEVTVIVKDNDEVVARYEGIEAGRRVTVPIKRTTVSK